MASTETRNPNARQTAGARLPAISAYRWVPDFARGLVRDLRVRWALEEIGRPYRTTLLSADLPRDADYRQWQPFGQVPAFDDGALRLFESGAILLYLGEQDERLLPGEPRARWNAIAWLIAALNSVEPAIALIANEDNADRDWNGTPPPATAALARQRLESVSDALGDQAWLAGRFSVADIMMVTVLRILRHTGIVSRFANLAAYVERSEARPAFERALAAQFADFEVEPLMQQGG